MKMTTATSSSRRSRESAGSSSGNRYSIDMLLPGLNQTKDERISNVSIIMSEKSNGSAAGILAGGSGSGKEINSMLPTGSVTTTKRKDGGGEYNNGEYLSTPSSPSGPSATTTTLSHRTNSNGTSSTRHHHQLEDQQEPQQQQQQRRGASKVNTAAPNSKITKKRSAASPLKPATQAKHMLLSAGGTGPGTYGGGPLLGGSKMSKKNMLDAFQPWVLQAYGDSAKTKTITKKKYYRIVKTLRGEEINNAENSKFRFWVKAKGFHIGLPPGHSGSKDPTCSSPLSSTSYSNEPDLFVPTAVKDASSEEKSIYKRVAVVEHFFDIIYTVHVETEAKNGKHAGQKRTYRAITEKYAFLPREAVTKFLLQCMECQKRGSPAGELFPTATSKTAQEEPISVQSSPSPQPSLPQPLSATNRAGAKVCKTMGGKATRKVSNRSRPADINFSLPFTTTYLRQQEEQEEEEEIKPEQRDDDYDEDDDEEKGLEDYDDEDAAHLSDATPMDEDHDHRSKIARNGDGKGDGEIPGGGGGAVEWLGYHPIGLKKEAPPPPTTLPPPPPAPTTCSNNNICSNGKHDFREQSSPLSLSDRSSGGGGGVNHEAGQDETSSNGNKDDEDDDDDESEDKIDTQQHDPERLKAFNMFVRLFVDENLDRMVPISKQPKEKIQAIIDSCTRQFPEFAERARKRIRTYLKSCRRNKRSRDSNGWESSRPTPAHLTSVQAEQILAQACENESQNAKRMRMGLEPVGQPLPAPMQQQTQQQQQNDRNNPTSDIVENGHHHGRSTTGSSRGGGGGGDRGNSRAVAAAIVSEDSSEKVNSRMVGSPAEIERNSKSSVLSGTGATAAVTPIGISSSSGAAATPPVTDMSTHTSSATNLNSANSISSIGVRSVSSSSSSPSTSSACENQYPSGGIQAAPKAHERSTAVDYSRPLNGSGIPNMSIFRPNLGQPFPRPAPFSALFPPAAASAVTAAAAAGLSSFTPHAGSALPIVNDTGPTDLSMKTNKPLLSHKLTASEITTVRQLIIGYRESAAFLLRSADELEQLLHQQQQ